MIKHKKKINWKVHDAVCLVRLSKNSKLLSNEFLEYIWININLRTS